MIKKLIVAGCILLLFSCAKSHDPQGPGLPQDYKLNIEDAPRYTLGIQEEYITDSTGAVVDTVKTVIQLESAFLYD